MPAVITYKEGILYVNGERVTYIKDANHTASPVMFGLSGVDGDLVPAKMTDDGKLQVAGDLNIDDNPMAKVNITSEYTYYVGGNGDGKVATIKEYFTGALVGDPAKLTTYTYNPAHKVSTIVVTDTTV